MAADRRWIRELTDAEAAALRDGTDSSATKPDALAPLADEILTVLEDGRGFVLLRGVPVNGLDDAALYALYRRLGDRLGTAITQNRNGDEIVEITDRGAKYGPGVRGYTTRAHLMPHCDATDVVALLCVNAARKGGESCIASAMTIFNEILAHHPDYLEVLASGFHHNMRGEGVTGDPNEVTRNAIPVFSDFAGKLSCHFNRRLILQGAEKTGRELPPATVAALDCVNDLALRDDIRFDMEFQPGDVQLLNNHLILHSRRDYEDHPDPALKRRLLRLWLNVPNGRPLAPEYADRTNGGPRGGMPVAGPAPS